MKRMIHRWMLTIATAVVAVLPAVQAQSAEVMNETGDMFAARALEKDGETAELYLFIIDDSNYQNAYSEVTWEVVLAVPDTMYFRLGEKTPGIINGENVCPSCEGSTKCAFCHGSGRYNYGAGYETCVNCDGTKICNICGGVGY